MSDGAAAPMSDGAAAPMSDGAAGRRRSEEATGRRTALFCGVVVALTVAMLALAGTTPREIGRPVEEPSRVELDTRTFSCAGGIEGTRTRTGNLRDGLAAARSLPSSGAQPLTLVADRGVAAGAFAAQQASTGGSLAWLPCPEPQARWWFVGAGGAASTHGTILTLSNPRSGEATVDIEVIGPQGPVAAPGFRDVVVAAGGTRVIDLTRTAPALGNLAVSITATRGLVAVSAVDRFAPGSVGAFTREWLPPQTLPARTVLLSGIPVERGPSVLMVANPGEREAIVTVEVVGATGTFVPEALDDFIVGPRSVSSLPLDAVIDGTPLALRISSEQRITATVRSVKAGESSFATGVRPVDGNTVFAVPDGSVRLLFSSVGSAGEARFVTYGSNGQRIASRTVEVGARATATSVLPGGARYVELEVSGSGIVGGLVATGPSGTTAAGIGTSSGSVRLPTVGVFW